MQELFLEGSRLTGSAAREKNLSDVLAVSNAVRSSYGPRGLDKMIVSKMGEVSVTNDGATILSSMEVPEAASRILVDLAVRQDEAVGDGTTSVVLLAAALVEHGMELINSGVHPTTVVSGYKTAFKQSAAFIASSLEKKIKTVTQNEMLRIAESTISSKVLGLCSKTFSKILVDAVQTVKKPGDKETTYAIEEINILKKQGKSMEESVFVSGYALNALPASELMPTRIAKPRVLCLNMDLQQIKMGLSVKITTDTPENLEKIREKEAHSSTERVKKLVRLGASLVLTTKGINDACIKVLVEAGAIGIRRCKIEDLERIAAITNTKVYTSFEEVDGTEILPVLGSADLLQIENFGDEKCTVLHSAKNTGSSVVLRGPNEQALDEMERSMRDGLCTLKKTLESKSVVVGGGAFETALSAYVSSLSLSFGTNEQIALQKYAEALLAIPKTLLSNAALNTNRLLSQLLYEHEKQNWDMGVDIASGEIRNNYKAGVLEPVDTKIKALRAATEAAISILRIDEVILLEKEEKGKNKGR